MNTILKTSICPICEITTCNSYHGDCRVIKYLKQSLKTLLIAEIEKVSFKNDWDYLEVKQAIEQLFSEKEQ